LKLLYRVSNGPVSSGRAKLESAVRYFRIGGQYAPEMAEPTAVYYIFGGKLVFNACLDLHCQ